MQANRPSVWLSTSKGGTFFVSAVPEIYEDTDG
jgi:hypothetical protein